jgi:hypothetical protein
MEKLVLSISLGLITMAMAAPAYAQSNAQGGSYRVDRNQLDDGSKIIPSRRKIQVIDERPEVTVFPRPQKEADTYEFQVADPGTIPGKHHVIKIGDPSGGAGSPVRMVNPGAGLAPASEMGQSQITNHNPIDTSHLAPGQSTGTHGPLGAAAMGPQHSNGVRKRVDASLAPQKAEQAKSYKSYPTSGAGNGTSGGGVTVTTGTSASLKTPTSQHKSPLMDRLPLSPQH